MTAGYLTNMLGIPLSRRTASRAKMIVAEIETSFQYRHSLMYEDTL